MSPVGGTASTRGPSVSPPKPRHRRFLGKVKRSPCGREGGGPRCSLRRCSAGLFSLPPRGTGAPRCPTPPAGRCGRGPRSALPHSPRRRPARGGSRRGDRQRACAHLPGMLINGEGAEKGRKKKKERKKTHPESERESERRRCHDSRWRRAAAAARLRPARPRSLSPGSVSAGRRGAAPRRGGGSREAPAMWIYTRPRRSRRGAGGGRRA